MVAEDVAATAAQLLSVAEELQEKWANMDPATQVHRLRPVRVHFGGVAGVVRVS